MKVLAVLCPNIQLSRKPDHEKRDNLNLILVVTIFIFYNIIPGVFNYYVLTYKIIVRDNLLIVLM